MKCSICEQEIEKGVLGKIKGTYVKIKGKNRPVCQDCQKMHANDLKNKLRQIFK